MKNVTTNITVGQVLFILMTLLFSSVMFFYLGAKFGPKMLQLGTGDHDAADAFLPDENEIKEVQEFLKNHKHKFVFFDALQSGQSIAQLPDNMEFTAPVATTPELIIEHDAVVTKNPEGIADAVVVAENDIKQAAPPQKSDQQPKAEKKPVPAIVAGVPLPAVKPLAADGALPPEVVPDAVPAPLPDVLYGLQLGSYSSQEKAEQALNVWKNRGYAARLIRTTNAGKGLWYRLSVGEFASHDEAKAAQKKILSAYRQNGRVIKYKKGND